LPNQFATSSRWPNTRRRRPYPSEMCWNGLSARVVWVTMLPSISIWVKPYPDTTSMGGNESHPRAVSFEQGGLRPTPEPIFTPHLPPCYPQ
jgi:hypothetical protein